MREVKVASSAGFCFGVQRAVDMVYREAESGEGPIYTYGPIIHNEQVVEDLKRRGVRVIESLDQLEGIRKGTVIIRSHGAAREVCDSIREKGLKLVDATCPFVKKIHNIVSRRSAAGEQIIVIGNPDHPEVQGICGWSESPVIVLSEESDVRSLRPEPGRSACIVSQTTFNLNKFNNFVEILADVGYDRCDVVNTICNATEERQREARELAGASDAMIVIGGRSSSNTQKLYEICKHECKETYYIQTLVDLDIRRLPSSGCVGITAGASTPKNIIEEVSKHVRKEF